MEKPTSMSDVNKMVANKNPTTPEEALKITQEIASTAPNLEDKIKKIQLARGGVIESSTHVEKLFDEIIILSGETKMVSSSPFMKKAKFVKELMGHFDTERKQLTDSFLAKLEKVVTIRNIFAHVPINIFSEVLKFDTSERYLGFFKGDLSLNDVSKSSEIFMSSCDEIMNNTMVFIKLTLEEAKKQQNFIKEVGKILKNDFSLDNSPKSSKKD